MIAFLALLALQAPPAAAGPPPGAPTVELSVSSESLTVGDPFLVEILLRLPSAAEVAAEPRFPAWAERWGEAEVLSAEPPRREAGAWRQQVRLAIFRPGDWVLPPIALRVPGTEETIEVTSPPLAVRIESVLPAAQESPQPRPAEPPRALPAGRRFAWSVVALAVACLLAGLVLARRLRDLEPTPATGPELDPLTALRRALESADAAPQRSDLLVSLELRRFLSRSLGFPAVERSTSEIHRSLLRRPLTADLVTRLTALLRATDGVKFARRPTDRVAAGRRRKEALALAQSLDALIHRPPAEEAAA